MAKQLTSAARAKTLEPKGTYPIVVIKINWVSGSKYYTEIPYTFDGNTCFDHIMEVDDFESVGKIGQSGEVSSINIKLDDTDGFIKSEINTAIIEGVECFAYHHYHDLTASDATLMVKGKLSGPIVWSDEERTFEATIESIRGTGEIGFAPDDNDIPNLAAGAIDQAWPIAFGSPLRVPGIKILEPTDDNPDNPVRYIVNLVSSSGIGSVYAKRNCYGGEDDDIYIVPSSYYSVNTSYSIAGKTATAITFSKPLGEYQGEGWSDSIFVDVQSSISSNTATQIQWILETFTNLSVDSTSFNDVANLISGLPSHFIITDLRDALPLAENMAWQARCLLLVKNGVAYLRPLFRQSVTDYEFTPNEVKLKSVRLSFTDTDDLVTVFNANWKTDYSGSQGSAQVFTKRQNTDKFGVVAEDYDFFIYTSSRQVQVSATFWAYRYAYSWRKCMFSCFLPAVPVEPYDCVGVSLPVISANTIRGFAESVKFNKDKSQIDFEIELGSKAGDHIGGQPVEDLSYWSSGGSISSGSLTPSAAVTAKTICESTPEQDLIDKIANSFSQEEPGVDCYLDFGAGEFGEVYEVVSIDLDGLHHIDIPSKDNLPPDKVIFTRGGFVGRLGKGYFASGKPQWCDYDLNPQNHPNYFDTPSTNVGDTVGTEKSKQYLTKARYGFDVVGKDSGYIAVTAGSLDPKLEKIKSNSTIPAFSPGEIIGYDGSNTVIQTPSQDSLPPGRLIFPITDVNAGDESLGYNSFDASPFVDGDEPGEIGVEMGTEAGSSQLVEGNTGFVYIARKGGKNQVRPF